MFAESTGIVRTALPLDYEAKNLYTLNVSARDEGTPSLVGFTSVIISVTDYNDLGPVFNAPSYSVAVPEDVQPNTTLVIVFATDPDLGIRANVRIFGFTIYFPSRIANCMIVFIL